MYSHSEGLTPGVGDFYEICEHSKAVFGTLVCGLILFFIFLFADSSSSTKIKFGGTKKYITYVIYLIILIASGYTTNIAHENVISFNGTRQTLIDIDTGSWTSISGLYLKTPNLKVIDYAYYIEWEVDIESNIDPTKHEVRHYECSYTPNYPVIIKFIIEHKDQLNLRDSDTYIKDPFIYKLKEFTERTLPVGDVEREMKEMGIELNHIRYTSETYYVNRFKREL